MNDETSMTTGRKIRSFLWRHKWVWLPAVGVVLAIQLLVVVRLISGGDLPPVDAIF